MHMHPTFHWPDDKNTILIIITKSKEGEQKQFKMQKIIEQLSKQMAICTWVTWRDNLTNTKIADSSEMEKVQIGDHTFSNKFIFTAKEEKGK